MARIETVNLDDRHSRPRGAACFQTQAHEALSRSCYATIAILFWSRRSQPPRFRPHASTLAAHEAKWSGTKKIL